MIRRPRVWSAAGASFAVFAMLALLLPRWLGLGGAPLWVLRGLLWLLAAVMAALVYFLTARRTKTSSPRRAPDPVDDAFAHARERMAQSAAPSSRIDRLPLLLLMGPQGSGKTTLAIRSGLDPDLVAGEAERGGVPVPTEHVNLWYADGVVLLEAASGLLEDDERWARLAHRVEPDRMRPMLTNRPQAPRAVIVAYDCGRLRQAGSEARREVEARTLRTRLHELGQRVGVRLPVYVVFTKADALPYFGDFVRNFTDREADQVLGATLPLAAMEDRTRFATTAPQVVGQRFQTLMRLLARGRLEQLERESQEEVKAGIYEFPREFSKIQDRVSRFLVELCRPSQLGAAPILRGFYFVGVRAVVQGEREAPRETSRSPQRRAGATLTSMEPETPAPVAGAGGRRVPQWVFLPSLLRRVVLRDEVALGLSASGHHLRLLRRVAIGVAAGLFLLLAGAFTVSKSANERLIAETTAAVAGVHPIESLGAGGASLPELRQLDRLRDQAETLRRYQTAGPPLRLRWGLYTGDDIHPTAWREYFAAFDRLLGQDARDAVVAFLRALPPRPDAATEYDAAYEALEAYLVMASNPDKGDPATLARVLHEHWLAGRQADGEVDELALRQFRFYASELPHGNPFAIRQDAELVARTRAFLLEFKDADRLYQVLVTDLSEQLEPIEFSRAISGASGVVAGRHRVPGAFTEAGWGRFHDQLEHIDELLARADWVTGGRTVAPADLDRLKQELRQRYREEYVAQWRRFLESASLASFRGARDAAAKLRVLSDNESPLLQMFRLIAEHTAVDSADIAPIFQPVHVVTPPDITDRYINDGNKPWVDAMGNLQGALAAAGDGPGAALSQASGLIGDGRSAVRRIAQGFRVEGQAQEVGSAVRQLLETPLREAESLVLNLPVAGVNRAGAAFCREFNELTRMYPFDRRASAEATVDDLNRMLQPGASALWSFHDETLQDLVYRQGDVYASRSGPPRVTRSFLEFFNRAVAISEALYDRSSRSPAVDFLLEPETSAELPEVTVSIDGQTQRFTRTFVAAQPFSWEGERAQTATITGRIAGGPELALVRAPSGTWALFRLLEQARWTSAGGGRYQLSWPVQGQQVTLRATLTLTGGAPVLNIQYLEGLRCVSTIATR